MFYPKIFKNISLKLWNDVISRCLILILVLGCSCAHKENEFPYDGQTSKALKTINEGEVEIADYVIAYGNNEDVIRFAREIKSDHFESEVATRDVISEEDIMLQEGRNSISYETAIENKKNLLFGLKGKELDSAYINDQILLHQRLLNDLKTDMIPNAQNKEFKDHLRSLAEEVEEHLKTAKEIQLNLI